MTKADIIEGVYEKVGFSKKESAEIVELVFDTVKETLERGDKIKISGFGNFQVRQKNARVGRNPQTGKEIEISARRVLTFRPSQVLKSALNCVGGGRCRCGGRGRWLRVRRSGLTHRGAGRYTAVPRSVAVSPSRSRGVAQPGSAPAWGAGGRRFKSCRPDHEPRNQAVSGSGASSWARCGGGRLRTAWKQARVTLYAAAVVTVACQPTHGPSSSLSACGPQEPCANAAEQCFSTAACGPPPGGCQTPETGDLKCHLTCVDDASCAEAERCVAQTIFAPPQGTDVLTVTHLCLPR